MDPSSSCSSSFLLRLPNVADLTPQHSAFLDQHFQTKRDLSHESSNLFLSSSLSQQCSELESMFLLHASKRTVSWISRSFRAKSSLQQLSLALRNLSLHTSPHGFGSKRFRRVLTEEIPRLAYEMNRIESLRCYLETAVQLEALVGDLEDASLFVMSCHTGNMFKSELLNSPISEDAGRKHDKLLQAIKAMNDIEEVLIGVEKFHPQWYCLLKSVDTRVDRILSALRPQIFADHRALLVSLGWPPKLFLSNSGNDRITDLPNPLVLMQEDKRRNYSRSFIALCALQHLQKRREERQLNNNNLIEIDTQYKQLWAIDELVSPIASRMEYHFTKWSEQPEYMFALAYKVTRDFIAGIDGVLQPLIDKARLVSCSAKEAWVSAVVQMLSGFLEKNVFSLLAERYKVKHLKSNVSSSWLHLVDLTIAFDKKMQFLLNLETCFLAVSESFEGQSRGVSVLSIFCNRPDWLKIWAKIEFKNAWKKLNTELKEEKSWVISRICKPGIDNNQEYLLLAVEDYKAPPIAEFFLKIICDIIERCKTMPSILSRAQFIRFTAGRLLWYFFKLLLFQFKAKELRLDNSDNVAIVMMCGLINAARYIWIKLHEWSDTIEFLEMKIAENDAGKPIQDNTMDNGCFFNEEIRSLSEMETNWLMEIIAVVLRQFEMLSWEYVQNDDSFKDNRDITNLREDVDLVVSDDFVEALYALKSWLQTVKINLNRKDFLDLWRSIAEGLDHYISGSIVRNEVWFFKVGANQFEADIQALIFIFQPYCVRPQAFFPCIGEILKLLKLKKEEVKLMQTLLSNNENGFECLHLYGISNLSVNQVLQVLRCKIWVG
ncbi:RINT1-like protein MAG2L isoform X1 [Vigna radiata var. radiata]|uniref:RINT1-like protein MAG2L isoform X1 n=2 Tax=Vigna radiata var. radiata TaxID=3916 RepID=A0A1S3W2Q2_VIGRR|nr:RINT1-like protein MAG2L isoform X1 [Vigna radiata var. radiata]